MPRGKYIRKTTKRNNKQVKTATSKAEQAVQDLWTMRVEERFSDFSHGFEKGFLAGLAHKKGAK